MGVAFCLVVLMVVASACNGNDLEPTPVSTSTRVTEPTLAATSQPSPSATAVATVASTSTPIPLDDFIPPDPATGVGDVREALIEGRLFQLELARTSSERARGLMERTSLPENAAMLFVYGSEEYRNFWMKNTLIPLDILYLNARGVVVDVQTMQPQIGVSDGALKVYPSAEPARYALEMNAGLAETLGIVPGTQVLFR